MKSPANLLPVLFCAFIFANLFGQANQFDVRQLRNNYDLNEKLFILPIDEDTLELAELQAPEWGSRFVPFNIFLAENYPGAEHPTWLDAKKTYWCRVVLNNHLPENTPLQNWILFTGKSNVTEVWMVHPGGRVEGPKLTGLMVPANCKDFIFGNQEHERVRVSLPPAASVTLFIKVKTPNLRRPWIDVHLTAEDYFHTWDFVIKTRENWLFIGFLLTFSLINLILFLGTQDRAFLYHFLFQVGIFIYLLEFFYMLYDIVWLRDHPIFVQTIIYLSICGMDMAYLQFIRTYMNLGKDFPKWDAVFKTLLVTRFLLAAGVVALFYTTNNMPLSDNITAVYMIAQYTGAGFLLLKFSRRDFKSLFLIVGTSIFIFGLVLNGWSVIIGTGLRFGYTQVGVIGEVLLFTLGLGYRMKILTQEQRNTQRLRDLDDFKTKFYTNITHEFRTPLTVIQGMTAQLRSELNLPAQLEKLDLVSSNGDYLLRLVNRMLALAKLQSGKTELNLRRGDIIEFLRYLTFSFQAFAFGKDIHIRFLTAMEKFDMDFDAGKLQDVMTNLVSNAIKFTLRGGKVTVLAKLEQQRNGSEQLRIEVKDTGIGMSGDEMTHIFERFYQGSAVKKAGQGTGLGLAITRELVKLMQGTIEVESEVGTGSVFSILLPVTRQAAEAAFEKLPPPSMDVQGKSVQLLDNAASFDDEKPLALVVEDNYDVMQFVKHLLEKNYYVATANDGEEGLKKAVELVPDVVISDVVMPEKDGLELCRALKSDERTSHIPIILLTAKASTEDRLVGLESGADAYLVKPFNQDELFLYLRNFLKVRQQLQERFKKMNDEKNELAAGFPAEDAFISKVREIVDENMEDEDFGVVQLCHKLGMSRSQLHRKITALTGASTSHLVNSFRLSAAKKLLKTTGLNVSEIAYSIGLEPNYFSRMFKENTGLTPTEFREQT
jgi:signal transduction histidine kinase/DNA-binding response OmpR family regulator